MNKTIPPTSLPDDPQLLKRMVMELKDELEASYRRQEQLKHQLDVLARRLFGRRSEKLDSNQLELVFAELAKLQGAEEVAEAADEEEPEPAEPESKRRRRGHGRRRLPAHLPRVRVEHEPAATDLECTGCGNGKTKIREEVSEQLEYVPATLKVIQHVRGIFVCTRCEENVTIAPAPVKPIAKGLAGPGLLAHIATSKYADHLPLNRLEGIFGRQGMRLSRSTMCDWIAGGADLASPVVEVMKRDLLGSRVIHTDDTTVPVLDAQRATTRTARLWVYLGDRDHEHIVFDYTADRKRAGPQTFLSGFSGYLQADAYGGYDGIYAGGDVIEVACWAHARRKFYDARQTDVSRGFTALAFVRQLYQIEAKIKNYDSSERQRFRQDHSKPVLAGFAEWLERESREVRPKSPIAEAITYARNQWEALKRYTEDGDLAIDNNAAERALRRVAIGRKNWMFAGSDAGGRRAAVFYSLIASCKLHGIDPFAYLRDLFERLPTHPNDALAELTPKAWAQAQALPDQIAA